MNSFRRIFNKVTLRDIADALFEAILKFPGLSLGIFLCIFLSCVAPDVSQVQNNTKILFYSTAAIGLFRVFASSIPGFMANGSNPNTWVISRISYTVLVRFTILYTLISLILILDPVVENLVPLLVQLPDIFVSLVLACIVTNVLPMFTVSFAKESPSVNDAGGRMAIAPRPRTESEIYRTAVHEAGHLLMFPLYGELPPNLSVRVRTESGVSAFGNLGCVTHSLTEPPRVSWRLQSLREWSYEKTTQVFP